MSSLNEALQQVPWAQFSHAYGSATDTPSHLLALLSNEAEEREKALSQLWISICHQGSVYEASAVAVPFLIRILQEVPDEQKPEILSLLNGLAGPYCYANREEVILRMSRSSQESHHEWHSVKQFLQTGNEYHKPQWMERNHQLVGEGLSIYLSLLRSAHRGIVRETLDLLSCFKELGSFIVPIVSELFSDSNDPSMNVSVLYCLSTLLDVQSPHWELYYQLVNTNPEQIDPRVRLTAACMLARYHRVGIPPVVVDILVKEMLQPVPDDMIVESSREEKPYYSLDCHSLSCLGVPLGLQGLINVLEQGASRWSILDTVRVAEAVLDVAFFGCWVENRYWNYTSVDYSFSCTNYSVDDEFLSSEREEIPPLDDENAYFQLEYSRSSSNFNGFLITVFGYDKSEAAKLKLRYEQEGIQALLAYQRDALQAVLQCKPLWQFKHNLMEIYGLPTSQKELAHLL